MSSSQFLDSFEVRKQEIVMINLTHFCYHYLKIFFEAYFAMFKFWATRIQETPKEPLTAFDWWQNMLKISSSLFLESF